MLIQSPKLIEGGPFAGLPQRAFRTIAADAPQEFRSYTALQVSNPGSRRDVERHYPTMSIEEIAQLPVRDLVHPEGAHLWLWVTGPNLMRAPEILKGWGFWYSSLGFVWVKLQRRFEQQPLFGLTERDFFCGLGLTTRHCAELCLLARAGSPRRLAKDVRELVIAPRRQHSRKPAEAFARMERYGAGPRIELFARETRPGWVSWGNETSKFDVPASTETGARDAAP
jgi:N6-adenosine-specific RNA methylase IME4